MLTRDQEKKLVAMFNQNPEIVRESARLKLFGYLTIAQMAKAVGVSPCSLRAKMQRMRVDRPGHLFHSRHYYHPDDVAKIKAQLSATRTRPPKVSQARRDEIVKVWETWGATYRKLADNFGLSYSTVCNIIADHKKNVERLKLMA